MAHPKVIRTERLFLRRWLPEDLDPFAAMNSDPRVMEHFPGLLSRQESNALAARIETGFEKNGFGLWAVEVRAVVDFAGFVGLAIPRFEAPFTPALEIGWRIGAEYWNRGYATEGARAVLRFGFEILHLDEIVSFTVPANRASRRVMEKIGMKHNLDDDFDHPSFAAKDPLRHHVLYRISRPGLANTVMQPPDGALDFE